MNIAASISASERQALAFYATLPVPVVPTQTFSPLLPSQYRDGANVELEGRPDALATQGRSYTFIEAKNGTLNFHPDKASSHRALQDEFMRTMHDAREKTYNFLTDHFYRTSPRVLLDHAWNHSLFKMLALQAEHGWQRYIVCFKKNPSQKDAKRYIEAGLVFCTEKTLLDMLRTIELAQHGLFVPYVLKTRTYGYSVTPDHHDRERTFAEIAMSDRKRYEATIAAHNRSLVAPDPF
ncbi:hypothetical protein [Massilia sp. LjRoot122]|uniref:hypothetical protein n=1 Tax=Massilia sp. LjRoot122 TaxID=3342257 RepID=UPI003ED0F335